MKLMNIEVVLKDQDGDFTEVTLSDNLQDVKYCTLNLVEVDEDTRTLKGGAFFKVEDMDLEDVKYFNLNEVKLTFENCNGVELEPTVDIQGDVWIKDGDVYITIL